MTTVLKLGGSVITDKDREETLDGAAMDTAAAAIATALEIPSGDGFAGGDRSSGVQKRGAFPLVVVHGAGSFGHVHASEHGVSTTAGSRDVGAVNAIHGSMKRLNGFVLERLLERGIPAVPVHPFSLGSRSVDGALTLPSEPVETLLEEGFVPVLHGDVIAHRDRGVTIISGDEIVTELATDLEADHVGLCSTVPGVLADDDTVIERIGRYEDVKAVLGASESTDVTGGMAAKVRELLALDAEASIFGLETLADFLEGQSPGTTIAHE